MTQSKQLPDPPVEKSCPKGTLSKIFLIQAKKVIFVVHKTSVVMVSPVGKGVTASSVFAAQQPAHPHHSMIVTTETIKYAHGLQNYDT